MEEIQPVEVKPVLSEDEIVKSSNAREYVKGVVRICPDDLVGTDLEAFLDELSQCLTGSDLLMDIGHQWVGWDPERKELLCEVTGDPASIVECMDLVECSLCGQDAPASTAHLHGNGWVGNCCWDERLRSSE